MQGILFRLVSGNLAIAVAGWMLQLAARRWPIRKFTTPPESKLDAIAWILSIAYGELYWPVLGDRLAEWPALAPLHSIYQALRACPPLVGCLIFFVVYDFFTYWFHRLQHHPRVWPVHAFHHSPRQLDWLAGNRESLIHNFLTTIPMTLAGVIAPISGVGAWVASFYALAHNSFIHSNLRINSRLVNAIFITGEHHFLHHAQDLKVGNTNFAFIFTVWDRMFGTYTDPGSVPADLELGLSYPVSAPRLMLGLPPRELRELAAAEPGLPQQEERSARRTGT